MDDAGEADFHCYYLLLANIVEFTKPFFDCKKI